ncbi:MAG: tRNA (adenosine(37)-N6)-dimethylallyltransferase MiaA [Caulobacteraceae bacterium]
MRASSIGAVWLIAGPTASGKSGLALRLAEALGGEIVNADSMQIYRDLQILTARPTPDETARAPHQLYGVADAAEVWSVGRWLTAARAALADIAERGRPAVVVGGTGLYLAALTQGLAEIPAIPDAIREDARTSYDAAGEEAFRQRLRARDPVAEARISPGDRQRLVRALEVVEATGRGIDDWRPTGVPTLPEGSYRRVVLEPARPALYARCDARMSAMVETGALDEVRALSARDLDPLLPCMKAVGVREFSQYLAGALSLSEAMDLAARETRRYAKRQSTWFRNQTPDWPRITELDPQAQWAALEAFGLTEAR